MNKIKLNSNLFVIVYVNKLLVNLKLYFENLYKMKVVILFYWIVYIFFKDLVIWNFCVLLKDFKFVVLKLSF